MKKQSYFLAVIACLATLVLGAASSAWADRPFSDSDSDGPFLDLDPCTGEEQFVTLYFDFDVHVHRNNLVVKVRRSGESSGGYTMFAGTETYVENYGASILKDSFVDMWRAEDGRLWQVGGIFVLNWATGDVKVDKFAFRCLNS